MVAPVRLALFLFQDIVLMMSGLANDLEFFLGQHQLRLQHPEGLWLLLAIPILFIIGLWMGEDLRWFRRLPIQVLRGALVAALAVAYARPVHLSESAAPAVVFLADGSASLDAESYTAMGDKIEGYWDMRGDSPSFLVSFDEHARLLAKAQKRRVSIEPRQAGLATDLASAMRFAYGLFPADYDKRMVIFSDGMETKGDALAEADRARDLGIQIWTVPTQDRSSLEVMMDGIEAPGSTRKDKATQVQALISSNRFAKARVSLMKDGSRVSVKPMRLQNGKNRQEFKVKFSRPGWHRLSALVAAKGDRFSENNTWSKMIWVIASPRILLVQKNEEANPLREILQNADWELSAATPDSMPSSVKELANYDLIVLDDLELGKLSAKLVSKLRTSVEDFGCGLLVTAGQGASDLADPGRKPIEQLIPLEFKQVKKKEQIPAAMVFVTDRSSSMARGGKFSILLRAVADTLGRIKDTAQVSVVMFDDFPETVVALTEAKNRDKIRKIVLSQRVGGGTSIYPALKAAHKELKKSAAKLKHIILLSDGQSMSMYDHYGYIVDKIASDNITITSVALGKDADQVELKRIAARTGGRFYFTDNISNVPKIFARETENITETNVIEQPIKVKRAKLVQALSGIDFSSSPALGGYIPSEALPTAEVLLVSSDRSEPILARWRYGLGRVMVLATDAQGAWSGGWTSWPQFSELWPRLADDTLRKTPPGRLVMSAEADSKEATVTVAVPVQGHNLEQIPPTLTARDPQGKLEKIHMIRRGLGLYRARFPLAQTGAYALETRRLSLQGTKEVTFASVSRAYPEEFLSAGTNTELLSQIARHTGAGLNPDPETIFRDGRHKRETTKDLWQYFLLAALGIFLSEVLIRRL